MIPFLKRSVEKLLCRGPVGLLVSVASGDWIISPSVPRGWRPVRVFAPGNAVPSDVRASLFWGFHEAQEIRFVNSWLSRELPVVELGTSLGVVAAHAARILDGRQKMVCVEANSRLLEMARATISANSPETQMSAVAGAVNYNASPRIPFIVSGDLISSHVGHGGTGLSYVPTVTLSAILREFEIGDYSLVCDIEGAELDLLENDSIALSRCRRIIAEFHSVRGKRAEEVAVMVENLGFTRSAQHGAVLVFTRP